MCCALTDTLLHTLRVTRSYFSNCLLPAILKQSGHFCSDLWYCYAHSVLAHLLSPYYLFVILINLSLLRFIPSTDWLQKGYWHVHEKKRSWSMEVDGS